MNSLPSQKRVWRRSIKYCLWIYVRCSLLHMRWQYTAKVKTARIPTEESLISVLPLSDEWTGQWRICSFQRRYLFIDACVGFIACRVAHHGQLHLSGLDSDTRLWTITARRPFTTSLRTLANRKILPVCAYSYVKTRTTSSMAKTSPLTEAWPKRWFIGNSPFIKQSVQHNNDRLMNMKKVFYRNPGSNHILSGCGTSQMAAGDLTQCLQELPSEAM